jgi:hypothetical protein
MTRTDILWASQILATKGNANAGWALGAPDGDEWPCGPGEAATFAGWRRASYEGLDQLLAHTIAGDSVTAEMLARADVIAWELNGTAPAPSGGWESCRWTFRDSQSQVEVVWNEATTNHIPGGPPVPRDPHVIANGSVTGAAYASFFGIPMSVITQYQPTVPPEAIVISFLLLHVRDEIDVTGPAFTLTLSAVDPVPNEQEATPDVEAIGVLLPAAATPPKLAPPRLSHARLIREICGKVRTSDAILPALTALWERRQAGLSPRNDFETSLYSAIDQMDEGHRKALAAGFAAYANFRDHLRVDKCLFDTSLATSMTATPLDRDVFTQRVLTEGLNLAADQLYPKSHGQMGAGKRRLWRLPPAFHAPDTHGEAPSVLAPWPWLTAIRDDPTSITDFGNVESFIPLPPDQIFQPKTEQFEQVCRIDVDPAHGGPIVTCDIVHPTGPPGGFVGFCLGGPRYTLGNNCLRIPAQQAGQSVRVRGFNLITPTVAMHLKSQDNPSQPEVTVICPVWGDQDTPATDASGAGIANMNVSDWVDLPLPLEDPQHIGSPFPPGIYALWATVKDPGDPATDQPPAERKSNELLLRILPGANVPFHFLSQHGRCIQATFGIGNDDEIWWNATAGNLLVRSSPADPGHPPSIDLRNVMHIAFPKPPWSDVDDGDIVDFKTVSLFGPAPFEQRMIAAIGLIGLEIDSEHAANDEIRNFGDAFSEGLGTALTVALAAEGAAIGLAQLAIKAGVAAGTAFTAALIAGAVVAVVAIVSLVAWAAWAAPDLIALDIIMLDPVSALDMTDPRKPLPAAATRRLGSGDDTVTVHQQPLRKEIGPSGDIATWVQENDYKTSRAHYALEFRLTRTQH